MCVCVCARVCALLCISARVYDCACACAVGMCSYMSKCSCMRMCLCLCCEHDKHVKSLHGFDGTVLKALDKLLTHRDEFTLFKRFSNRFRFQICLNPFKRACPKGNVIGLTVATAADATV